MTRARTTRGKAQRAQHAPAADSTSAIQTPKVLADTIVMLTGLHNKTKERCAKLVEDLGATLFTGTVMPHNLPHVAVTQSWRSERVQAVRVCNPNMPVVLPSWLEACMTQQQKFTSAKGATTRRNAPAAVSFAQHTVPVLSGCRISITGFAEQKAELQVLVENHGGKHAADLTKDCTHLISDGAPSAKLRAACDWHKETGIVVVSLQWLRDCVVHAAYLDPGDYPVAPPLAAPQPAAPQPAAPQPAQPPAAPAPRAPPPAPVSAPAAHPPAPGNTCCPPPRTTLQPRGRAVVQGNSDPKPAGTPAVYRDGLYLACVRVALMGCDGALFNELRGMLCAGGATRHATLEPQVTHIVVGPSPTKEEQQQIREHRSAFPCVQVTTPAWLRDCNAASAALCCEKYVVDMTITQVQDDTVRNSTVVAVDKGVGSGERNMDTMFGPSTSNLPEGRLFEGLAFTLAPIRGTPEEEPARQLIKRAGGRLFDQATMQVAMHSRPIAVCPPSLTKRQMQQLSEGGATRDFRHVPADNCVTVYWLECCVKANTRIPFHLRPNDPKANRSTLLYRPFAFALPLKGFDLCRITSSVYSYRGEIKRLVQLLGGTWTEAFSKRNTHLLVPRASGTKYDAAGRWGVTCLRVEWLLDCALQGQRLKETAYMPLPADAATQCTAAPTTTQPPPTTHVPHSNNTQPSTNSQAHATHATTQAHTHQPAHPAALPLPSAAVAAFPAALYTTMPTPALPRGTSALPPAGGSLLDSLVPEASCVGGGGVGGGGVTVGLLSGGGAQAMGLGVARRANKVGDCVASDNGGGGGNGGGNKDGVNNGNGNNGAVEVPQPPLRAAATVATANDEDALLLLERQVAAMGGGGGGGGTAVEGMFGTQAQPAGGGRVTHGGGRVAAGGTILHHHHHPELSHAASDRSRSTAAHKRGSGRESDAESSGRLAKRSRAGAGASRRGAPSVTTRSSGRTRQQVADAMMSSQLEMSQQVGYDTRRVVAADENAVPIANGHVFSGVPGRGAAELKQRLDSLARSGVSDGGAGGGDDELKSLGLV